MLGGTLALLVRSLRVDARRIHLHLSRALLVGLIYMNLIAAQQSQLFFGAPGLRFFSMMSFLNFFFISLAGVSFFATAITEEKEEMTLGLLKIAGIRPLALLLGKSTPRLLSAMLLLSVQFPFTLLAITLGGVTIHQVLSTYLSLLAYLLMLANVALFFSVFSRSSSAASWRTGLLLALFLFSPFLLQLLDRDLVKYKWIASDGFAATMLLEASSRLRSISPWMRLLFLMQTGALARTVGTGTIGSWLSLFDVQIISNLIISAVFFILSWCLFDRCTRVEHSASPSRGPLARQIWIGRFFGVGRSWRHALAWKDFYFLTGGLTMMFIKLLLYGMLIPGYFIVNYLSQPDRYIFDREALALLLMDSMIAVAVVEILIYTSRIFLDEVKWNTLSGISMLPLSTVELVCGKIIGCLLALVPAITFFLIGAFLDLRTLFDALERFIVEPMFWSILSQFVCFLHLLAYLSLLAKQGAFPLAVALVYTLYVSVIIPLGIFRIRPDEDFIGIFTILVSIAGIFPLQAAIGRRLQLLASR